MNNPRDKGKASRFDSDIDEVVQFEKFRRGERSVLPVSSGRNADRMSKKTLGSRRVKKQISQRCGGIHRRRQKTVR